MNPFDRLILDLDQGPSVLDVGTLLGCLAVAGGICWLAGRKRAADSVWFGRAVVDGLLFPLMALALTYVMGLLLKQFHHVPLLRLAVPVLVSLAAIRLLARVFTLAFPASRAAKLVERIFSWVAWIAAALWILGLLPAAREELDAIRFAFGGTSISLLAIVKSVLTSGLVLVLALWVSATLERKVLRDNISDLSLRKAAANATRAVLLVVGLLVALSAVGVDLTALSVLGGAVGVGLGFGLQKLAANYVSGFVILSERSLRIGDTVRVDGFEGVVADIKTRYTLIRAGNGRASIVPNEKLISERVENLSLTDPRLLLTTDIAVGYDSDPVLVMQLLEDAAMRTQRVLADPAPACKLARFGPDGLEFTLLYWIDDPQNGQLGVRSDVNVRALQSLRAAGIDIPFPQRVVHLRPAPPPAASASGTEETG